MDVLAVILLLSAVPVQGMGGLSLSTQRTIAEIRYCPTCGTPFIYMGDLTVCRKCQEAKDGTS
jgi:hypothetical protein